MRIAPALFCLAFACAPVRPRLGELSIRALWPLMPTVVDTARFVIATGRITASGANAGSRLDLVVTDDACLRGDADLETVYLCAAPPDPSDPPGVARWHSVGHAVVNYSTRLLSMGDVLRIEARLLAVELKLPDGPAGDEVRSHPELLGAAFVFGLLPASKDRELALYSVDSSK